MSVYGEKIEGLSLKLKYIEPMFFNKFIIHIHTITNKLVQFLKIEIYQFIYAQTLITISCFFH